jgi:23S rRNA (uracil1939-C5)-methyltransferase
LLEVPVLSQLASKHGAVVAAFSGYPALQRVAVQPVEPARPMLHYRTRAKLVVSAGGEAGEIGLFARGSHEVVDIPHCQIMHPALLEVVAAVRRHAANKPGLLTSIDVRVVHEVQASGTQEPADLSLRPVKGVLLTLTGNAREEAALRALCMLLAQHALVLGVAARLQSQTASRQLEGDVIPIAGQAVQRDQLRPGGPYHYATFGSFVQAHAGQAAAIAEHVHRALDRVAPVRGQRILELYSGSGALGLELCARGAEVCLVEKYAPALAFAEQAAREQQLSRVQCRAGEADEVVRECVVRNQSFDAVVVNPPRRGLSAGLRELLPRLSARALIYISCEPTTLARDLADLGHRGWAVSSAKPFDMIPLSLGVETLVVLEPARPTAIRVLYEDEQLLIVDKPPHLPTTPDPAHASSVLERLQAEHALPQLTAVHRLDVGTSGVCMFAKRRSDVQLLSGRLREGEKHYLALVKGAIRTKGIVRATLREQGKTRPAVSRYTRVSREGTHSLVRVRPEQGRTHQVRKHMAAIGHPVLGDLRYGDAPSNRYFEHRHGLDRTFLHAARLVLPGQGTSSAIAVEAELTGDLASVLSSLRSMD